MDLGTKDSLAGSRAREIGQAGGLAWPGLAKSDSASASAWPDPGLEVSYDRTSSVIILLCSKCIASGE